MNKIFKDFYDYAIAEIAEVGLRMGYREEPWNYGKNREVHKNQMEIRQLGDWNESLISSYSSKFNNDEEKEHIKDILIENLPDNFHGFLEKIFNEAIVISNEIAMEDWGEYNVSPIYKRTPEIIEELQQKYNPFNSKVSKWKKIFAAAPELIQKMQDQFYDPEQIIVANYVQQFGKSITVNPRNLEYWEKADIVADLMRHRQFVSNLFDEAQKFADSFINEYNLDDAEIVKEKFLEAIEEEINDIRDRYLNDIYNEIYEDALKVGKQIAEYFMDDKTVELKNWPIKERLDEIKNLEEGYSSLNDYAHRWGFDEVYTVNNVFLILERADLDPGWDAWSEGIEEGFLSTINVEKIKDLLGTDTSYLYEPIDPSQEAYLNPEQTDENEAKKHRRNIADKWKVQYEKSPGKKLNWATEEDFPKKRWESSIKFKKFANLSPELVELAKEMAQDIVPHPLDYMRAQEEYLGSEYISEYRSIVVALEKNWSYAIETASESINDAMWHNLHYEINENPYLDEDLKQDIEDNIDYFRDEVWEQTEPILDILWQETVNQYIQDISNTYDDIIFEAFNRLNEDIRDFWGGDNETINVFVNSLISGEIDALSFLDKLTVYAEQEIDWLQNLSPSLIEPIKENARKSADKYIEEKISDLIDYIGETVPNTKIQEMYEPVDSSQEAYLGPDETDENEAKKHRKQIKDKWKIQPNQPLQWATEEEFPKKPWDFKSKVAAPNQFLPRLYHTMIENLKRTAVFNWESESNPWQKVQVAYEILNDWDGYVDEIQEEIGWKGPDYHLNALMRDAFIDIFKPVFESFMYVDNDELHSQFEKMHNDIRQNNYGNTAYIIDHALYKAYTETGYYLDLQEHPKWSPSEIINFYKDSPPESEKDYEDLRKNEILDKWQPEDWWKGSKWKKVSADEIEEEEEEEELIRPWEDIEWELSNNMHFDGRSYLDNFMGYYDWSEEPWNYVTPNGVYGDERDFLRFVENIKDSYQLQEWADEWARDHFDEFYDSFINSAEYDFNYSGITDEEYSHYESDIDEMVRDAARESAYEWVGDFESRVYEEFENTLSDAEEQVFENFREEKIKQDRRLHPDQQMMDVFDVKEELPYIAPDPPSPWVIDLMRQQSKVAGHLDPIAYITGNGSYLCPFCAEKAYGVDENGWPKQQSDGSPSPVAPWDEWYDPSPGAWAYQMLICEDCGETVDDYENRDSEDWDYAFGGMDKTEIKAAQKDMRKHEKDRRWTEEKNNQQKRQETLNRWEPEGWWRGSKWKISGYFDERDENNFYRIVKNQEDYGSDLCENCAKKYINYLQPGSDLDYTGTKYPALFKDEYPDSQYWWNPCEECGLNRNQNWNPDAKDIKLSLHSILDSINDQLANRQYDKQAWLEYFPNAIPRIQQVLAELRDWASVHPEVQFMEDMFGRKTDVFEYFENLIATGAKTSEEWDRRQEKANEQLHQEINEDERNKKTKEIQEKWEPEGWWKGSSYEDWSEETDILIDHIIRDDRILNPAIKTMEKIVRRGGTPQDLTNWIIENILNPYNEQIAQQWEQVSDEQDVEDQKRQLRRTWKQQARKQFPFSLQKQKQYVQEMEQMQFGFFGEPEPEQIEQYLLKVENIDWQGIYDWVKEDLQYRGKMASSDNEENKYQEFKQSEIIQDVFKKLYSDGVSWGNEEVKNIIRTETGRQPYEWFQYNPNGRDNWPKPDRFYDQNQLSIFREILNNGYRWGLKEKALRVSKIRFDEIIEPLLKLMKEKKVNRENLVQEGAQYYIEGYQAAAKGIYKNQLELARARKNNPENWRQSKWKIISNEKQYKIDWTNASLETFKKIIDSLPNEVLRLASDRALHNFNRDMNIALTPGGDIDELLDVEEHEEGLYRGAYDHVDRNISPNQLPLSFEKLKDKGKITMLNDSNNLNQLQTFKTYMLQRLIEDLLFEHWGNAAEIQIASEEIVNALAEDEVKKLFNIFVKTYKDEWDRYFKEKTSSHGQNQMAIGDEVAETTFEGVEVDPDPEPEEKIINGKKWKMVRPKPNKQPAEYARPKGGWGFYSKKDAWEAVLDGELGHDIITTGTWEEVKKQTIKWLKQLKDGYINKKNPHDNKKIDAEAKEQDGHALEDLKLYEEEKRWSFHFDHGKHPYDLIIQPVGYKESKV